MKKILLLFLFIFISSVAFASNNDYITNEQAAKIQKHIDEIGFNILNSNGIEKRTTFNFDTKRDKNACSYYSHREIVIYRDLYNRLASDDELAYILGHEISHSVDGYDGILRGYFTFFHNWWFLGAKKYEYKADKRAVDYMVQAGYNPVASIIVMSKIMPQYRYDWYSTHPLTTRRMMEIYEYIYKKYPEYLANNVYKNNPYYQNFLLTSKENRAKFQKKVQLNTNTKAKYL